MEHVSDTFHTSCHFKWYLRHFLLVYIAVTAYISISVASKSRQKICPKPRANLVTEMSDRWPTSSCFWVHSLCQKLECMGKHVREALRERKTSKQQCHCLTLSSDTDDLAIVSKCVTKKIQQRDTVLFFDFMTTPNFCYSSDSAGFRSF